MLDFSKGTLIDGSWGPRAKLLGRTLALTAAYKQLAVSPDQNFVRALVAFSSHLEEAGVLHFQRSDLWCVEQCLSLQQGGQKFVAYHWVEFGRPNIMMILPDVELEPIANNSKAFMEFVLTVLGWRYASEGKKAELPNQKFKVLGVEFDFFPAHKTILFWLQTKQIALQTS